MKQILLGFWWHKLFQSYVSHMEECDPVLLVIGPKPAQV